jgi:predicted DNA-binding transcriptional regulator AlpA
VGREVDSDLLIGTAEVADRLGIAQPQTIHLWRRRYSDFPEPVASLSAGLVWYWPDVEAWAQATDRLP